jgi:hypothetical protein
MIKDLAKVLQISTSTTILVLAGVACYQTMQLSNLRSEVRETKIRNIHLNVFDDKQNRISEYSVSIEPKYSFDEIHPTYSFSTMDDHSTMIHASFNRHLVIKVSAKGFKSMVYEHEDESSPFVSIGLSPIESLAE